MFVVDDDVSVRESLELLIAVGGWTAECYASASDFLARSPSVREGCLILDVCLPDMSGIDVQRRLSAEADPLPVIFITGHGDVPTTVKAMKGGAFEFLIKPFPDHVLLTAIEEAVDHSRATRRTSDELSTLQRRYALLTPRERDVMSLVVQGLLNKQVAGELGAAEPTVKTHRGRVMRKMEADSLADLVRMAQRLGLPHRR